MALVAGIDSSTQACKVVVRDADTGALTRQGRSTHPSGSEVAPAAWEQAAREAVRDAGGLADVAALAVGAQQHGMVCLDAGGQVVRPALLWNDLRSASAASDLVAELGADIGGDGPRAWAQAVGSVPLASFTVTKLRWLAEHEPENTARTAAVCLPHDWLTWRFRGTVGIDQLTTDRGDASGTGYWSPAEGAYRLDLLRLALGRDVHLPRVLGPTGSPGTSEGVLLGPGTGDNAAAALGVGARPGDVVLSIGTSGVVSVVAGTPAADPSGTVAGFADATGRFLPLICTVNAARVLDAAAGLLGVDHDELSRLALSASAGSSGVVMVPYLEGERTPNRPRSTGAVHGLQVGTSRADLARAAVEGLLCGLADGVDALVAQGARVERVLLIGGGARSEAVRRLAPAVLGYPVLVPPAGEYVADGAARQAAWVLSGSAEPPLWTAAEGERYDADATPVVRERYAEARDLTLSR